MTTVSYDVLENSTCDDPPEHLCLGPTAPGELITIRLILRRRARTDSRDVRAAEAFARASGLHVFGTDATAESVVARGTASALERAFGVRLHDYQSPLGKYRSYAGAASLPAGLAPIIESVEGLDTRNAHAQRR